MSLIFIVGLPGSGKTTLLKTKFSDPSLFLVYDDHNFGMSDFKKIEELPSSITVIIADPRLCNRSYYDYLKQIFEKKRHIETIILPLSLEECKNNIVKRESDPVKRQKFIVSAECLNSKIWFR